MSDQVNAPETSADGIVLTGISKTFGSARVIKDVSLTFRAGEITGLLGENGAGKSTLFKILAGIYDPDPGGRMWVNRVEVQLPMKSTDAADLGFAFVHQDLGLAVSLSVMENVFVGAMLTKHGLIDWRGQGEKVAALLREFGVSVSPKTLVGELTQAEKAVVAIARAVYARGRLRPTLLVLDEPTANLAGKERDCLFEAMRLAASLGAAVAFCTHRLEEVMEVTDAVVVLRDGNVVASQPTHEIQDESELATHILGRKLEQQLSSRISKPSIGSAAVLEVADVSGGPIRDLSFVVHAGEIVGVTGLAGAGQDAIPELLLGSVGLRAGSVSVNGKAVAKSSPRAAIAAGIGMLPADRKKRSALLSASIKENLTLVSLDQLTKRGIIMRKAENAHATKMMSNFDVRPAGEPERPMNTLSGGNQQKVLLAKWISKQGIRCMVLHEPTQGVDVGAKQMILELIAELAASGVSVVMVSSEPEELSYLCDRVLIVRSGRVCAELANPTAPLITEQCYVA